VTRGATLKILHLLLLSPYNDAVAIVTEAKVAFLWEGIAV